MTSCLLDDVGSVADLGARIKAERLARGLSISELAGAAGVSRSTVRKIELGQANPRLGTMLALTRALGVSLGAAKVSVQ